MKSNSIWAKTYQSSSETTDVLLLFIDSHVEPFKISLMLRQNLDIIENQTQRKANALSEFFCGHLNGLLYLKTMIPKISDTTLSCVIFDNKYIYVT